MFFQSNNIRKVISAALLMVLLFVHGIKLLHTHSYNHFKASSGISKIGKSCGAGNVATGNDCSICNYQLNKDADDPCYSADILIRSFQSSFAIEFNSFKLSSFHFSFEGRGPPATMRNTSYNMLA